MRVVVAKKPFKGRAVGTEVNVAARDARVLFALGLATRVMPEAEAEVVAEVVVEEPEPKAENRTYRRRDMTAKD